MSTLLWLILFSIGTTFNIFIWCFFVNNLDDWFNEYNENTMLLQRCLMDEGLAKKNESTVTQARQLLVAYRRDMGKLSVPMLQQVHINRVVRWVSVRSIKGHFVGTNFKTRELTWRIKYWQFEDDNRTYIVQGHLVCKRVMLLLCKSCFNICDNVSVLQTWYVLSFELTFIYGDKVCL